METIDGGAEPEQKPKAKPVPWTEAEIKTLQRAIGVHGTRWTLIKQDPEFKDVLWRPVGSLASKWLTLDPTKRSPDAPQGSKKRKDAPGKKDGKAKKPAKRLPFDELLARAFDAAPTSSELSVHSEAEEEEENEVGTEELAANLVAQLMEDDMELEGLVGFGSGAQEGGKEAASGGTGPTGVSGAGLSSEEKRKDPQMTEGIPNTLRGPDFGQGLGGGPPKAGDGIAAQGANAAAEAAVPMGGGESVKVDERAKQGGPEVGGLQLNGDHTVGGAYGGAAEGVNVSVAEDGGLPKPQEGSGGLGQPHAGGLEGGAKPVESLERVLDGDLLKASGLVREEEHFEDAPNEKRNPPLDLNMGLSEIQPGEVMDQALGFSPEEEVMEEAVPEENAVLAQKRAEMQLMERKARVLESKKDAWLRAFDKKRAQYESRMADVENVCRRREQAQEAQRQVVYQEKWALEAARQGAAQLVQDLLTLVPAPDNISLEKLHPSMPWEATFGPQCSIRRQIIEQLFEKRQRAVGMLKAAALDAHCKKLTMSKKLGLDVREEELTEEALQQLPEFQAFNQKLDELKRQMETDVQQLNEKESAARSAWIAFQEKGEKVRDAEAQLKALLKEGQMKKPRVKMGRKTM